MASGKLTAAKYCGWVLLGSSMLFFVLSYYGMGPDCAPLLVIPFLIVGILWWWKVVPAFRRQCILEQAAMRYEATLRTDHVATGDERILRAASLRLVPGVNRWDWLTDDGVAVGSVVGTHEMGRLCVAAVNSDEFVLLRLRCARPGAWYHYGYKRRVRWTVVEPHDERTIGSIVLRPTFLGRFKWPIVTESDPKFGEVKAGVEWSRIPMGLGGAITAAIIPNMKHHATVFMRSRPVCVVSWLGESAAVTFAQGEFELTERKLAIAVAVLLACCPDYYRHA
jgi:hypothetical protein